MQHTMLYQTALNRIADAHRNASLYTGVPERRIRNQAHSWSSVAFWQMKRIQRA